jgi:hypothetical protein
MYLSPVLFVFFNLFQVGVAPNIAERNPWSVEETTSFYERFHPSEFEPVMRDRVKSLLHEFEQVSLLLENNCLCISSLSHKLAIKCRENILRAGVLLRHVQSNDIWNEKYIEMIRWIHEFRKEIGGTFWDKHLIVEMQSLLHQMHYELQRPWNRNLLMMLAHRWQEMPEFFSSN